MSQKGEGRRAGVEGIDWNDILRALVTWTRRRHRRSLEDAKDIAQEAIRRFFDPDYVPYDTAVHGTVLWFLRSIVNGIVVNEHRRTVSAKSFLGFADETEDLSPEAHAVVVEHADLVVEKLLERTKHDPVVHRLLLAMVAGVEGTEELSAALGVAATEIERLRKRLRRHLDAVTNCLGDN